MDDLKAARELRLWIKDVLNPTNQTRMEKATNNTKILTDALKKLNYELKELKKNTGSSTIILREIKNLSKQSSIQTNFMASLTLIIAVMALLQLGLTWNQSGQPLWYGLATFVIAVLFIYVIWQWIRDSKLHLISKPK